MREIKLSWEKLTEILKKTEVLLPDSDKPKEGNEYIEGITTVQGRQLLIRVGRVHKDKKGSLQSKSSQLKEEVNGNG